MPRYHFALVDHHTVEDKVGQVLTNDVMASDVSDRLAQDLYQVRPELRGKSYSILVSGPDGEMVHNAPVKGVITLSTKRANYYLSSCPR
jgi:hypothetical protein